MKNIQPLHLILGGCGLAIISVFLPWSSVSANIPKEAAALSGLVASRSASVSGINYNTGVFALIVMAGVIASCYVKVPGKSKLIATAALGAAGLALLLILIEFLRGLTNSTGSDIVSVSVGIGLYLCILGAAAGGYGAFLRWQKTPADPTPPNQPPPPQA
jgi:hypothetical protein